MQIHRSFDNLNLVKNPVVTTGSFDGVHVGHKVIINRLRELAKEINGESVLITFHPHPRKVLYPETAGKDLKLINTQNEKIDLLEKAGLDHLIIIEFTRDFAKTTSQQFSNNILLDKLGAKIIIVGFNHHFGHNREGDYNYLFELAKTRDFRVEEIPEQDIQNETVSSTKIRKALTEGNIGRANAYLDHEYIIMGKLNDNSEKVHDFLKYEVEIEEDVKLIPPEGIYAISLRDGVNSVRGFARIVQAEKYTYGKSVQLHFFEAIDTYCEKLVTIYFHKFMRASMQFNSISEEIAQLNLDAVNVEELIY